MNLYFAGKRKRHNYHHKARKRSVQYDKIEKTLKAILECFILDNEKKVPDTIHRGKNAL